MLYAAKRHGVCVTTSRKKPWRRRPFLNGSSGSRLPFSFAGFPEGGLVGALVGSVTWSRIARGFPFAEGRESVVGARFLEF